MTFFKFTVFLKILMCVHYMIMRYMSHKKNILTICGILSILVIPDFVYAQEDQKQLDVPLEYTVGIQLENIGVIDRQSGSYDLIFWVTIISDEIDFIKNPPPSEFDFTNGYVETISGKSTLSSFPPPSEYDSTNEYDFTNEYVEEIPGMNMESSFHKFKVRGVFYNAIDFKDYPFEHIDLAIHMEPYYPNTDEKLIFTLHPEFNGISDSKTISVPGWELGKPIFLIEPKSYPWGNFTHYEAHYEIGTTAFSAFMKKLFPIGILMGFSFATFAMSPKNQAERLGIISAALLSAIFFHTGFLLAELPPLGYMTLADKIMMTAYALFVICLTPVLLQRYFVEIRKKEFTLEQQILLDKKLTIVTPIILGTIFLIIYYFL